MPILVRENTSVLFIHIPKCGGSSFEQQMADRGWGELLSIRGINAKNLKFLRCSPQHMHAELLTRILRPEFFDTIITLVREPVSRLKSEYAWQRAQEMTDLKPDIWIEHVFSEFKKNPFVYDNHIRPQHEFLIEKGLIYKLEENGINQALEVVSPAPQKRNIFHSLRGKTQNTWLKKTNKSPAIHEAFQNKLTQVQDFYAKDYEVLGYSHS
jgi:hypothetical protein